MLNYHLLHWHGGTDQKAAPFPGMACCRCAQYYDSHSLLRKHFLSVHIPGWYQCPFCEAAYTRMPALNHHRRECAARKELQAKEAAEAAERRRQRGQAKKEAALRRLMAPIPPIPSKQPRLILPRPPPTPPPPQEEPLDLSVPRREETSVPEKEGEEREEEEQEEEEFGPPVWLQNLIEARGIGKKL